eukprot:GDKI01019658.1.p1 GENE.GDKI01019658.1~~GDKI01019658.1.p1  ORF type:complete len:423 (-),score=128.26 GDKI01019658.1:241-1464(-)
MWRSEPRLEELRAVLLQRLLQNRANAIKVHRHELRAFTTDVEDSETESEREGDLKEQSDSDRQTDSHVVTTAKAKGSDQSDAASGAQSSGRSVSVTVSMDGLQPLGVAWRKVTHTLTSVTGHSIVAPVGAVCHAVMPSGGGVVRCQTEQLAATAVADSNSPTTNSNSSSSSSSKPNGTTAVGSVKANSSKASDKEVPDLLVLDYLYQPGQFTPYQSLWPAAARWLSGECHDINRKSIRLLNRHVRRQWSEDKHAGKLQADAVTGELPPAETLPVPGVKQRVSMDIVRKLDSRNFETNAELASVWAVVMNMGQMDKMDIKGLIKVARTCGVASRGVFLLEGVYRVEEHILQTENYYSNPSFMIPCSLGMWVVNATAIAYVLRSHPLAFAPFMFIRLVKDANNDAFRFL